MLKKAASQKRKPKPISNEATEETRTLRLRLMRRDLNLERGGLQFEWGFYPMPIGNTDDPANVERLWETWNKLCFERGCAIAHKYMLHTRHMPDETETEIKIELMQERY